MTVFSQATHTGTSPPVSGDMYNKDFRQENFIVFFSIHYRVQRFFISTGSELSMAYSAPGVASTNETTNYARLCRLLVDIGTQALRDTFDTIHPPANLYTVLSENKSTLQSLKDKKVISPVQWGKLFPVISTAVSSRNFDTTLLMVLLRNICGLSPPLAGWDSLPDASEDSLEADLARITYYRNTIYGHAEQASVDDVKFNDSWCDIVRRW